MRVDPAAAAAALCCMQHVLTACHFVVFRHAYTQSSVTVWNWWGDVRVKETGFKQRVTCS